MAIAKGCLIIMIRTTRAGPTTTLVIGRLRLTHKTFYFRNLPRIGQLLTTFTAIHLAWALSMSCLEHRNPTRLPGSAFEPQQWSFQHRSQNMSLLWLPSQSQSQSLTKNGLPWPSWSGLASDVCNFILDYSPAPSDPATMIPFALPCPNKSYFYLRAFALAYSFVWNPLPPVTYIVNSLIPCKSYTSPSQRGPLWQLYRKLQPLYVFHSSP